MGIKIKRDYFTKSLQDVDRVVLFCTLFLVSIGILMIYSITGISIYNNRLNDPLGYVIKSVFSTLVGFGGMLAVLFIPYQVVKKILGPLAIGGTLVLLLMALILGDGTAASDVRRWVSIGGFSFQPAEFARIGLVVSCAWIIQFLVEKNEYYTSKLISKSLYPLAYVALCGVMIIAQRDLGSALIVLGIGLIMFFSSGVNNKQIAAVLGIGVIGALVIFLNLEGYQAQRFEIWLDPFNHDRGLQNVMGFISIAQGGLTGVRLGNSMQKYGFAIEPHTDFIITIIAEELGAIMVVLIMIAYFLIVMRCFSTALKGRDIFSSLICIGVGSFFLIQPLVNLGGIIGLIPLSGVTLPLISYGGTSLMATFIMIGIYFNARSEIMRCIRVEEKQAIRAAKQLSKKVIPFKQMG